MTKQICQNPACGKEFDPADRAGPTTPEASVRQIIYCSPGCKRQTGNQRYYQAHPKEIIERNLENQRKAKAKAK